MADEELASISALMLDQFTTYSMTGWSPRCRSDEFISLKLVKSRGQFILRFVGNQRELVDDIVLDSVESYIIKVPTWHEVKQVDRPWVALYLSKAANFCDFYEMLVSTLRILRKYDRLADRVGADERTFIHELNIARIRMEQISIGEQSTGDRQDVPRRKLPSLHSAAPPLPPARPPVTKTLSHPLVPVLDQQRQPQRQTSISFPSSQQHCEVEVESDSDDEYYFVIPSDNKNERPPRWVCPRCTLINKSLKYLCSACAKPRYDAWLCKRCSTVNRIDRAACIGCNMLRCRRCDYQNETDTARCAVCNSDL